MTAQNDVRAFAQKRVGYVLDRKYEILSYIGHGGMSIVYLASDRRLNKTWAVKEFRKTGEQMKDDVFRQSLLDEANLMKGLSHPALPRIVDIIEADGTIFIVMDFIEGMNLKALMKKQGHPMDEKDVIDWGIQLCDVLDYLHTPDPKKNKPRIVYRDMKPENVMLRDDGSVCLIDFGIARKFDAAKSGDTTILGTREYAAPEQLDATVQTDWRADIYSLGVTLHYLVTGHNPKKNIFQTRPIREYNPRLNEGLEIIIDRCVRYNRDERYQSCREIAYDLEHHDSLTTVYRSRLKSKVRTFTGLCIAAAACLAVGIGGTALASMEKASTYDAYMSAGNNILLPELPESGAPGYDEAKAEYDKAAAAKVQEYENAVKVDPAQPEPYRSILETDVADGDLSSGEYSDFYSILDAYGKSCAEYPALCYEYGSALFSFTENYSQASTWFRNALDAGGLTGEQQANAETYIAISDFRKNLDSREKQGLESSADYVEYWGNLVDACTKLESAPVMPRSKLKLYELIVDACSSQAYVLPFRNGGISQADLESRIDYVLEQTKALNAQIISGEDRSLYEYILAHCGEGSLSNADTAYEVIERTYAIKLDANNDAAQQPVGGSFGGSPASAKAGD